MLVRFTAISSAGMVSGISSELMMKSEQVARLFEPSVVVAVISTVPSPPSGKALMVTSPSSSTVAMLSSSDAHFTVCVVALAGQMLVSSWRA